MASTAPFIACEGCTGRPTDALSSAPLEEHPVLIEGVNDPLHVGLNGVGGRVVARKTPGHRGRDGLGVVASIAVGEDEGVGELDRPARLAIGAEGEGAPDGDEPEVGPGAGVVAADRGEVLHITKLPLG
jgi:hypothetical protein